MPIFFRFAVPSAGLLLLLAGCASDQPAEPLQQPALPPPSQTEELALPTPPPPAQPEADVSASVPESVRSKSARQPGSGFLPGVKERQAAGEKPAQPELFEQRLQERKKRVDLGLESSEREQDPVGNLLDMDF